MPEWVVFLVLLLALRHVLARGRICGPRRYERIERGRATARPEPVARSRPAEMLTPPDPVATLQKDWVDGWITVEEYEAGLDRVYRGKS